MHVNDSGVRRAAVEALSARQPRAVLPLTETLADDDRRVRAASVEALAKLDEPSVDPLIHELK